MKIQDTNHHNIYKTNRLKLVKSEEKQANKLLVDLSKTKDNLEADLLKTKLLDLYEKHLNVEVNKHSDTFLYKEDFKQGLYLRFFEIIEQVRTKAILPNSFVEELTKILKPIKEEKKETELSLNMPLKHNSPLVRKDILTNDDLPLYASEKTPQQLKQIKKKVDVILNNTILKENEKLVLDEKLHGKSNKKLGMELGLSTNRIRQCYLSGLIKLKQKNGVVPDKIKQLASVLDISVTDFIKSGVKAPDVFNMDIETIYQNIVETSRILGISKDLCVKTFLKQATLFYLKPETIKQNIVDSAKYLNLSEETFIKASLKIPTLMYSKPETLKNNISESAKMLGVSEKEFLKEALKRPALFSIKAENIEKRFKALDFYSNFKKTAKNKKLYIATFSLNYIYNNTLTVLMKRELKDVCKITQKNMLKVVNDLPARNFRFHLPKHEIAKEFATYTKDYFTKNFPKHTCSFAIDGKKLKI